MLASGRWFGCAPLGGSISTVRTDHFSDSISRSVEFAASHSSLFPLPVQLRMLMERNLAYHYDRAVHQTYGVSHK